VILAVVLIPLPSSFGVRAVRTYNISSGDLLLLRSIICLIIFNLFSSSFYFSVQFPQSEERKSVI
jgi:hypothetical protein